MNKAIHLLHADDDEEDRWIFRDAAYEANPSLVLTQFADGQELLRYLEEIADTDALLAIACDMQMPLVGGLVVLEKIGQRYSHRRIPIVILSTSSSPMDIKKSMDLGATAFLTKPLTYREYMKIVEQIIETCTSQVQQAHTTCRGY